MRQLFLSRVVVLLAVTFGLSLSQANAQGDSCSAAIGISAGTYTADGPSSGAGATNSSATNADWYYFIASSSGSVTVSSCGASEDTRLYIHNGSCGSLSSVASNDDDCGLQSSVTFNVNCLDTYYIEWDDRWSTSGFDFTVTGSAISSLTELDSIEVGLSSVTGLNSGCSLGNEMISVVYQNGGANNVDTIDIIAVINGSTIDTIASGLSGLTTCDVDTASGMVDFSTFSGAIAVDIVIVASGDTITSNDTLSSVINSSSIMTTFPYTESWETGSADWFAGGQNNSWELGTPDNSIIDTAFDGTQAWVTNLDSSYNNSEVSYVQSPCFNVSGMTIPKVELGVWWESESSWDGANLQYSDDGGQTWQLLGAQNTGTNWYNDGTTSGLSTAGTGSQEAWTGRNGSGSDMWVSATNNIDTAGLDSIIIFRMYFGSDGGGSDEGFAFDNFSLSQVPAIDASITSVVGLNNNLCGTDSAELQIILENMGTSELINVPVEASINGSTYTLAVTFNDTLSPGESDTVWTTLAVASGLSNISLATNYTGEENTSNDTMSINFNSAPIISSFPFTESWETGAASWSTGGPNNTWELGVPNNSIIDTAFDGTQAWVTNLDGNYGSNEDSYVQSPCFNVSSLNIPQVSFGLWWESEFSYDGANLQYSDDGGQTWQLLGAQNSGTNWYNDGSISGLTGAGVSSQEGWTGRNGSGSNMWVTAKNTLDTTGLDSIVIFRLYFGSDGFGQDEGIGFDAFRFEEKPPFDAAITEINSTEFECGADSAEFEIIVSNEGTVELFNIPIHTALNGGSYSLAYTYTDTLGLGESDTFMLTVPVATGNNVFSAATVYPGESVPSNDTAFANFNSGAILSSFPYSESWESGAADWFVGGSPTTWELGQPNNSVIDTAYHGTEAWATNLTGDYQSGEEGYIQSPCFNLNSLNTPEIKLATWWEAEFSWDGANVQYSDDGGATWNILGAQGTGTNWYNDGTISGLSGIGANNQEGWTGRTGSGSNMWVLSTNHMDTTGLDSIVIFRIYFGSDGSGQDEGFAVDSFSIYEQPIVDDASISSILGNGNLCSDTLDLVITNEGTSILTTIPFEVIVNGGTAVSGTYNGSLNPTESDTIQFPSSVTLGVNSIVAYSTLTTDVDLSNDTLDANAYYGDFQTLMTINTGGFATEINWYLYDQNNDTVASIMPNGYVNNNITVYSDICLVSTDTFTFEAWDDYGDGWNNGFYHLSFCDTNGILANNDSLDPENGSTSFSNELEVSETFTLPQAPLTYSSVITDADCFGANTGEIAITAAGGLMPYDFSWSSMDTTLSIDSVNAGDYIFEITDSTGCWSFLDTLTVGQPAQFFSTATAMNTTCPEGMDGMVTVTADSGGLAPFTFMWDDANMTMNDTVNNVMTGTYLVTITDANGCEYTDTAMVMSNNASPVVSITGTDSICADGVSTLDAGSGFDVYSWNGGSANQTLDVTTTGSYEVTVTDTNGCVNADTFDVFAFPALMVAVNGTDVTCEGDMDGMATAIASGGDTTSYNYVWSNAATSATATNLMEGSYVVTVTDAFGCTTEDSVAIGFMFNNPTFAFDPDQVQAIQTINVSAGSFNSYAWSTGDTTMSIDVTTTGDYSVTVTDANGCSTTDSIYVEIWPLGVEQVDATTMRVYPNPSTGIFNLSLGNVPADQVEITVMNVNGQVVNTTTSNVQSGIVTDVIDLSNAASGVYFMQVKINDSVSTLRLSVQ